MEEKKYEYDAFISYRHCEPDKFVAETLHKMLETYKLPGSLKGKTTRSKITRVFRDQDELPLASNLEDPIIDALSKSEYLIVICSPRLRESIWCQKEIETFIGMHGRRKVLMVLAEGEPSESFPEQMLYDEKEVTMENGEKQIVRIPMEPLAADFRGSTHGEMKKKMKVEILRLLAPMFGTGYDDLRQRHRERRMKSIITGVSLVAAAAIIFGVYFAWTAVKITKQKNEISAQAHQITLQALDIKNQADQISEQNDKLLLATAQGLAEKAQEAYEKADRINALRYAYTALTEYEGMQLPYTPEAELMLTMGTRLYASGTDVRQVFCMLMPGTVQEFEISPDGYYVIGHDNLGTIMLYSIVDDMPVFEMSTDIGSSSGNHKYGFIGEKYAYLVNESELYLCEYKEGGELINTGIEAYSVFNSDNDKYFTVSEFNQVTVYETETMQSVYEQKLSFSKFFDLFNVTEDGEHAICAYRKTLETNETFSLINLSDGSEVFVTPISGYNIIGAQCIGDMMYIAINGMDEERHSDYHIYALNVNNGDILWDVHSTYSMMKYVLFGEDSICVVNNGGSAIMLSLEDGSVLSRLSAGADIVGAINLPTLYVCAKEDGTYIAFNKEDGMVIDFGARLINYDNVNCVKKWLGGYIATTRNENALQVYSVLKNPDMEEYEGEVAPFDAEEIMITTLKTILHEEYNDPNYHRACNAFYAEDGSKLVVTYMNAKMTIFNCADHSVWGTGECEEAIRQYLGMDKNGNRYYASYDYGYVFNPEGKVIARIDELKMIDEDKEHLIISTREGYKRIKIYSLADQLEAAKEVIEKYPN